jgi:hypothetical protein
VKRRYVISIVIALTVSAVWFFLLFAPEMSRRRELETACSDSEARLKEFNDILINFPEYFDSQRQLLEKKKHLVSKLYSRDDLMKLFEEMYSRSDRRTLVLIEISPSVEELLEFNKRMAEENELQPLDITIKLRGPLKNIGKYIEEIEAQDFYMGINYCRITNPVDDHLHSDASYSFKAILGTIKDI